MIQTITNIDSLIKVSNTIVELQKDFEKVDTRVDDIYLWTAILVGFIVVILIGSFFNSNNTARKQAIEELEKMKGRIDEGEERIIEYEQKISRLENRFSLLNKQVSKDE